MKYVNLENCVEEIFFAETETRRRTLRKCNNYAKAHGRDDIDYQFEDGEVGVQFEFFDGYAIATDGSGLYMTYPTLDKVSKSKTMTERVEDYIGIYDNSISNHDIAMYYGVLKFSEGYFKASTPDNNEDEATTDEDKEDSLHDTLIVVSRVIFDEVVEMTHDFRKTIEIVKEISKRFEDYWDELMNNPADPDYKEYDYITEVEQFVKECLAELHDIYDLKEEDFDEESDDEEQTFETEEDVREFLNDVIGKIGWAFNPDESMCTYLDEDNEEYLFTQEEADYLDELMDEACDFCDKHDIDIYELSDEICNELHGDPFDEDDDEEDDEPTDEDNDEPKYEIPGFEEAMEAYADAMATFNKIMGKI